MDEENNSSSHESDPGLEEKIKNQVKDMNTWLRLFYMLVFGVVFYAVFFITVAISLIQFVANILSGKRLGSLDDFNQTLADYARDLVAFLTFRSDRKPFPFKE